MKHLLGGIQWSVFLIASAIATPIAIAAAFNMEQIETMLFIQRTIFVLGLATILQAVLGHRLPINEGPAGLWWGIFMIYASFAGIIYPSKDATLQALQSGLLYSGILFIIFTSTGLVSKMKKLFTPTATFIYLLLLVLQLSGTFVKGMFGVVNEHTPMDGTVLLASVAVVFITFYFMGHKIKWINRYSIMFGFLVGWLLFLIIGKAESFALSSDKIFTIPQIFVYGPPIWDSGMFATALFLTLLLIANMLASIRVMEYVLKGTLDIEKPSREKQGSFISGLNQMISGLFSAVGSVPLSSAAGFVSVTRLVALVPFVIGGLLVIIISLFPVLMGVLASLPPAVAYAVTFAIFTKMFELAFHELLKEEKLERAFRVGAIGVMSGIGIMFVPLESLQQLPSILIALLSNGLITGTLIAILLEQFYIWKERKEKINLSSQKDPVN